MAENTNIEWCDHTFNPWIGCTKVAPACDHCYAEVSTPARTMKIPWGSHAERHRTADSTWAMPKRWNDQHEAFFAQHGRRQRVFCASLADVFDNQVPEQWRTDLFELIRLTPNLDWLLLTKRPQNIVRMVQTSGAIAGNGTRYLPDQVWLGTTAEDQARANQNIPALLRTRSELGARVLFLSMEPLLGPVDLGAWIGDESCHVCRTRFYGDEMNLKPGGVKTVDFEEQPEDEENIRRVCPNCKTINTIGEVGEVDEEERGGGLHWVIVGGESGHHARPMHPDWARSLRDQCQAAGVPFLFKQHGEHLPVETEPDSTEGPLVYAVDGMGELPDGRHTVIKAHGHEFVRVGKKAAGRLLDGRTWDGFPA